MTEFIMGNHCFFKEEAAYFVVRVTGYRELNPNQSWMCVVCRIPFFKRWSWFFQPWHAKDDRITPNKTTNIFLKKKKML